MFWIYYLLIITFNLLHNHWLPEMMINEHDKEFINNIDIELEK